jgi:hypothetical protein
MVPCRFRRLDEWANDVRLAEHARPLKVAFRCWRGGRFWRRRLVVLNDERDILVGFASGDHLLHNRLQLRIRH